MGVEVDNNRSEFFPDTPAAFDEPPVTSREDPLPEWLLMHQPSPPAELVTADEPAVWSVVSWSMTPNEMGKLKQHYSSALRDHFGSSGNHTLSTVDALTADIVKKCDFNADTIRLNVVKDFRRELGNANYFGNALIILGLDVPNSEELPGVLRKSVEGAKSRAFVEWKIKQTICGLELSGSHLLVNSWFRTINPEQIVFERAASYVNFAMKQYRDEVVERKRKAPVAQILPQGTGLRINLFVRRSVAHALFEASSVQSCSDIEVQ